MSKLRVRIEFHPSQGQESLTPQEISDLVTAIFADAGISKDVVSMGVNEVGLEEITPLGIDPGTAAVLVALIGMSVELIKLGFELEKRDEELAIKKRELALKEEDLKTRQIPEEATGNMDELIEEFVNKVLLVRLMEKHNIQPLNVYIQIER